MLQVDTVIELHITASKTDNMKLKHACLEFMANNLAAVQKTEGYRSMSEDSSFMVQQLPDHLLPSNLLPKVLRRAQKFLHGN